MIVIKTETSPHESDDIELSDEVLRLLKLVPRVGMVVITGVVWMMMVGARGM